MQGRQEILGLSSDFNSDCDYDDDSDYNDDYDSRPNCSNCCQHHYYHHFFLLQSLMSAQGSQEGEKATEKPPACTPRHRVLRNSRGEQGRLVVVVVVVVVIVGLRQGQSQIS